MGDADQFRWEVKKAIDLISSYRRPVVMDPDPYVVWTKRKSLVDRSRKAEAVQHAHNAIDLWERMQMSSPAIRQAAASGISLPPSGTPVSTSALDGFVRWVEGSPPGPNPIPSGGPAGTYWQAAHMQAQGDLRGAAVMFSRIRREIGPDSKYAIYSDLAWDRLQGKRGGVRLLDYLPEPQTVANADFLTSARSKATVSFQQAVQGGQTFNPQRLQVTKPVHIGYGLTERTAVEEERAVEALSPASSPVKNGLIIAGIAVGAAWLFGR